MNTEKSDFIEFSVFPLVNRILAFLLAIFLVGGAVGTGITAAITSTGKKTETADEQTAEKYGTRDGKIIDSEPLVFTSGEDDAFYIESLPLSEELQEYTYYICNLIQADSIQSAAISQYYKTEVTHEIGAATSVVEQAFVAADEQLLSVITNINSVLSGDIESVNTAISQLQQTVNSLTLSYTNKYTGGVNNVYQPLEYGGNMTLTNIDRAAPTVSLSTSGVTASSVNISVASSTTCDIWQYSTDGGASWTTFTFCMQLNDIGIISVNCNNKLNTSE